MKRFLTLSGLAFLTAYLLINCQNNSSATALQINSENPISKQFTKDTISLVTVGDMMLGSAYPSKNNLPPDDAINSFNEVEKYLKGDIVFGNLEGCFLNNGKSTKCTDPNSNNCFAFRMPERYAPIYKKAGFNVLSIANNHIGDFGTLGRRRTAAVLDSLQIHYAGQLNKPFEIFEQNGLKFAFCAFAPNENTVSIKNIDSAKFLVKKLKTLADIVIVSFHGGGEGANFEHITRKTEFFYDENRGNVYVFAHAVIDAGADIVLGHGPHVTRAVEVYKNKFIAYSLGNFCTYGMFSLKGPNGFAPLLQIKLNGKGDFLVADVISVKQDKINRLTVDNEFTAFKKLQTLTQFDFPDNSLKFENNKIFVSN